METQNFLQIFNNVIAALFLICYSYQFFYIIVPFIKKDKPHKEEKLHRYAVLIAARNEEKVIGNLIDSISLQTYSADLTDIFVVADNCTDNTAETARGLGAYVYERHNIQKVGKGYALNYLLSSMDRDGLINDYDAFLVLDADNVLSSDYLYQMNRTFSDGYKIITSYRNSKNYGDNWISAGYALWFLRESRFLNHSRHLLGTSAAVSGTGFMFSREVLQKCSGWNFFLLTEDIEFTIHNVIAGEKIGYCKDAMLFDEQPVKFSQSWRQRMRWAKGYLQVFGKYGKDLISGAARGRFACADMCFSILPAIVLTLLCFAVNCLGTLFSGSISFKDALASTLSAFSGTYLLMLFIGAVTTVSQWSKIGTTSIKKVLYTFTFPIFMMTYIPISAAAMVSRVEWKPIEHNVCLTIADLESGRSRTAGN